VTLGNFNGEPDGGLAWWGGHDPFFIVEIGYLDTAVKTRNRAQNWIVRGAGQVYILLPILC